MDKPGKKTFDDFDKLNLKDFADSLLRNMDHGVKSSVGEPGSHTISLNAEFGNGKTTFLQMFENYIKYTRQNDYDVVFINAWESDFYKEPVITILSEFANLISENNKEQNIKKKVIEIIGNIGNQFIQAKTGINLKEIKNSAEAGDKLLEDFNQRKEAIEKIKKVIGEYTKAKKLLIIVDELDRARPDYAIHFLEDMKHFFDIPNIIFLVAVNRKQMQQTTKCLYGQDLNFDGYYSKFFKYETNLPDPYKEAQKFVDNLISKTNIKYGGDQEIRKENTYLSCKMFKLTLREIEYYINIFAQILESKNKITNWIHMDAYSFFICLFMKKREGFNKILNGDFSVDLFVKFINDQEVPYQLGENFEIKSDNTKPYGSNNLVYCNNYLFGTVACSLIKNEQDISTISKIFSSLGSKKYIDQEFFNAGRQPAISICENIQQCKSAFDTT